MLGSQMLQAQNRNMDLADSLAKVREENAALKAQGAERHMHRAVVGTSLVAGPLLMGVGLDQFAGDKTPGGAIVTALLGAIIIIVGAYTFWMRGKT